MRRPLGVAAALVIAGCAGRLEPNYAATLTAGRGAGPGRATTFAIAAPTGLDADLASQTQDIVRSGLEARGMKSALADRADIIVDVEFALGAPRIVSEWVLTPLFRTVTTPGYTTRRQVGTDRDGRAIYTPVTVSGTSTQQQVGMSYYCASTTLYEKQLRLAARQAREGSTSQGWDVRVAVRDNVKNPARYAPMLARAAVANAGTEASAETPITLVNGGRKVNARKMPDVTVPDTAEVRRRTLPVEGEPCGYDHTDGKRVRPGTQPLE